MDVIKTAVLGVGAGVIAAVLYSSAKGNQGGLTAEIVKPADVVCVKSPLEMRLEVRGGGEVYFADWQLNGPNGASVSQGFDVNTNGVFLLRPKVPDAGLYTVQAVVATAPKRDSAFNVMKSVSAEATFQAQYCP